jgi:hypothetical protein
MLDPVVSQTFDERARQWMELLDEEPDASLGNADLGASRPVSSIPWRRRPCRPWVTGYATSTVSSSRAFATVGRRKDPTIGCAIPTRGRSCVRRSASRSSSAARSSCATGACVSLRTIPRRCSAFLTTGLGWLWRQDGQYAAPLDRVGRAFLRLPTVQRGRLCRLHGRFARSRIADPRSLSR